MAEKAALEQQVASKDEVIENLQKQLVAEDQCQADVEGELTESAIVATTHAVYVLKSHVPNLDVGLLSRGYGCAEGEIEKLMEEHRPGVTAFVAKLAPSVSDDEE